MQPHNTHNDIAPVEFNVPSLTDKISRVRAALTVENFRQWLEQHSLDEIIGIAGVCGGCPIAKFLIETTQVKYISVSNEFIAGFRDRIVYFANSPHCNAPPLPSWVPSFINTIDQSQSQSISPLHALHVLDSLTTNY